MDNDQETVASEQRGDAATCGPSPGPGCWAVWMPIETAPKTNRSILVYCPGCNCQFMVCWNDHRNEWTVFGAYPERLEHEPAQWRELPDDPPNAGHQSLSGAR